MTQVLIIDEVSMLHPLLFTKLNILGQLLRRDPRPFGESLRKLSFTLLRLSDLSFYIRWTSIGRLRRFLSVASS